MFYVSNSKTVICQQLDKNQLGIGKDMNLEIRTSVRDPVLTLASCVMLDRSGHLSGMYLFTSIESSLVGLESFLRSGTGSCSYIALKEKWVNKIVLE